MDVEVRFGSASIAVGKWKYATGTLLVQVAINRDTICFMRWMNEVSAILYLGMTETNFHLCV